MIAILYCRQTPVERIRGLERERLVMDATAMLARLTDDEMQDWTLVIVPADGLPERLFGPKV